MLLLLWSWNITTVVSPYLKTISTIRFKPRGGCLILKLPLERFELPTFTLQECCTSQLCYKGIKFFTKEAENLTSKRCHPTDVGICCSHLVFLQVDITITTFVKNSKLLLIVIIDFISSHAPLERFSTSLHLAI